MAAGPGWHPPADGSGRLSAHDPEGSPGGRRHRPARRPAPLPAHRPRALPDGLARRSMVARHRSARARDSHPPARPSLAPRRRLPETHGPATRGPSPIHGRCGRNARILPSGDLGRSAEADDRPRVRPLWSGDRAGFGFLAADHARPADRPATPGTRARGRRSLDRGSPRDAGDHRTDRFQAAEPDPAAGPGKGARENNPGPASRAGLRRTEDPLRQTCRRPPMDARLATPGPEQERPARRPESARFRKLPRRLPAKARRLHPRPRLPSRPGRRFGRLRPRRKP